MTIVNNFNTVQYFSIPDRPPLVVIFEDFEGFLPAVVQNFVTICRYAQYTNKNTNIF